MISFKEIEMLRECNNAQIFYTEGTNLGILKNFESFKAKLAHAKSQVDRWCLHANKIYLHPSNRMLIINTIKYLNEDDCKKQLLLFGMKVCFSVFICNDDCIVADVSVPVSDRSVVIFKI